MIRLAGFALASLSLIFGLVASAESQQITIKVAWRPAQPVYQTFVEQFTSGYEPKVDLRPEIRKRGLRVRNQGNRGTCTVFATTFLIEYQKAGTPGTKPGLALSEEYLNWAGNKATGENADGGFFTKFMPGYETWAISTAKEMPYRASYNTAHPDTPGTKAIAAAKAMFPTRYQFTVLKVWNNQNGMTAAELQNAIATLRSGRPVATGIWWLSNFATVRVHGVPLLKDYPRSANSKPNPP